MEQKEEPRAVPERWRTMPDRVKPEDQRTSTPAGLPPGNQVISGEEQIPLPQG
jgi:hypothetical protein